MWSIAASTDQAELDADPLVRLHCPSVAAYEDIVGRARGRGDQGIVRRSAADSDFDKARDQSAVFSGTKRHARLGEASSEEVPHEVPGDAVGWRQTRQDGECLDRAMSHEPSLA